MRFAVLASSAALLALGCASDDDDDLSFAVPTEIAVAPADFLGGLSCSSFEGAVQSYVVTLHAFDGPDDGTPFTIGSSLPTPCSAVAGFRDVIVIGKRYTATIDAYDVAASRLVPLGGTSSGSRQMVLDGEPLPARWSTSCGGGPQTAPIAKLAERVFVRPCEPLSGAAGTTALAVSARDVLGDDACALAASVDITFETGGLPATTGLPCDAAAVTYEATAGAHYRLYATAAIEGVVHGASCFAQAIEGVTVRPSCSAPSPVGSATVSLAGVGAPPICPSGSWFDLFAADEQLNALPLPCDVTVSVGPYEPGELILAATIYDAMGAVESASCTASIEAGKTTAAVCTPL
jgi:hypothetical protein